MIVFHGYVRRSSFDAKTASMEKNTSKYMQTSNTQYPKEAGEVYIVFSKIYFWWLQINCPVYMIQSKMWHIVVLDITYINLCQIDRVV